MDDVTIARALHVISVVPWIGGVAVVATILPEPVPAPGRQRRSVNRLSRSACISIRNPIA